MSEGKISHSQCEIIFRFFQRTLKKVKRGAITTVEGQLLDLRYENLVDIGTLPFACQTVQQYLGLKDGDMALVNDPYCGGTTLSTFTLVAAVSLKPRMKKGDLLIALRFGLRPMISLEETIEAEGVRVPPTPIVQDGRVNEETLKAISAHPRCPSTFLKEVERHIVLLQSVCSEFVMLRETLQIPLERSALKEYLHQSNRMMVRQLEAIPRNEAQAKTRFDSGEGIYLKLSTLRGIVQMDFSGTQPSKRCCLTHSATFGVAFGTLLAILNKPLPINQGTFEVLDVVTSSDSLLNAKYPAPSYKGCTDGAGRLANCILSAFGDISTKLMVADHGHAYCPIELRFQDGSHFFDALPGGCGATPDHDGTDGVQMWSKNFRDPSVEQVEKRFPFLVKSVMTKPSSGGVGDHRGGHGLVKAYQILAPAQMTWSLEQARSVARGRRTGKLGSPSEIFLQRASTGKREKLESEGTIEVGAGDLVTVHSAGGGGYSITA